MPRFTSLKTFEQVKRPRKLPERSHLGIEFPQSNGRIFRTYIPFLQNPIITERGESNLNQYDLVGRAGSLFSYGGAKSRVFNLQFTINLLHLLYTDSTESIDTKFLRQFNLFFADEERAKKAFKLRPGGELDQEKAKVGSAYDALYAAEDFAVETAFDKQFNTIDPHTAGPNGEDYSHLLGEDPLEYDGGRHQLALDQIEFQEVNVMEAELDLIALQGDITQEVMDDAFDPDIKIGKGFPHAETHRTFYRKALGIMTGGDESLFQTPVFDSIANDFVEFLNVKPLDGVGNVTPGIITPQDQINRLNKLINCVYVWINLVRATTLNNAKNTTQGPPIVRLTHGAMFNNVPCVVADYNIDMNQDAGYEVETLTPKEITITMTLKEFRTNGAFHQGKLELGDNLAGWEAIIGNNNIDPYNGAITEDPSEVFQERATNEYNTFRSE
mgnify:CR=1 FL=1|tara:strand:+ start:8154 stop:9479 length:1326 start_codon:yes stop_codon:yes gene_type:complete